MRSLFALCIVSVFAAVAGCGREAPASPSVAPASGGTPGVAQITGTERLAWEQGASSSADLLSIAYSMYVDGERRTLNEVSCGGLNSELTAACSARLPTLSAGPHSLSLTSVNAEGIESPPSGSLEVVVVRAAAVASVASADATQGGVAAAGADGGFVRP